MPRCASGSSHLSAEHMGLNLGSKHDGMKRFSLSLYLSLSLPPPLSLSLSLSLSACVCVFVSA